MPANSPLLFGHSRMGNLMGFVSGAVFPPLPDGEFDIIYADPPWHYKGQMQHNGAGKETTGGAIAHYGCVSLDDLSNLEVKIHRCERLPSIHVVVQPAPGSSYSAREGVGVQLGNSGFRVGQEEGQSWLLHNEPVRTLSCLQTRLYSQAAGRTKCRAACKTLSDSDRRKTAQVSAHSGARQLSRF